MSKKGKLPTACPVAYWADKEIREGKEVECHDDDIIRGYCKTPALWLQKNVVPSPTTFIDCAAVDARFNYINCQQFSLWFLNKVAEKIAERQKMPMKREAT